MAEGSRAVRISTYVICRLASEMGVDNVLDRLRDDLNGPEGHLLLAQEL